MATETHAVFASKADAEKYQSLKDKAAGLPAMQGQPGGDDPTGRRHLYPAQRMTEHAENVPVVAASDGAAFAVTLDPKIDPGANAVKGVLTDAKWADAKPVKAEAAAEKPIEDGPVGEVAVKGK
jgi:hypothetical protein